MIKQDARQNLKKAARHGLREMGMGCERTSGKSGFKRKTKKELTTKKT